MIKRLFLLILTLASAGVLLAQQTGGGGGVPGSGGGTATLPTATAAGQDLRATGAGTTYVAQNATNQKELSCASDIGAQFNAAVTALSSVGRIILPNCTTATMSTTANVPPGISVQGYGELASIITCSVAGDCFSYTQNPTSTGEISGEYSNFALIPNGASGQVLWHNHGMSGATMHNLYFGISNAAGPATACLEFDNAATGQFTERNRTYNIITDQKCTIGVLFNQNTADSSTSFGYNIFEFSNAIASGNWGVVGTSSQAGGSLTSMLYNGSLTIFANHVGPGGGVLQFLNGFSTASAIGTANERLYITAEENGTGSGTVVNIPSTGSLVRVYGNIVNGAFNGSGTVLATTLNDPSSAFNLTTDVPQTNAGTYTMTSTGAGVAPLSVQGLASDNQTLLTLDGTLQSGGKKWQLNNQSGVLTNFALTDGSTPEMLIGTSTGPLKGFNSLTTVGWNASTPFVNSTLSLDTGMSRDAAGVIDFGGGTQGSKTAVLKFAQFVPQGTAPTMAAGAAAGTSPTCTTVAAGSNNTSGVLSCTTGTATTASATLATVTFNGTLNTAPNVCQLFPRNAATALQATAIFTTAPTTTTWTIAVGGTAVTASTAYSWGYQCL